MVMQNPYLKSSKRPRTVEAPEAALPEAPRNVAPQEPNMTLIAAPTATITNVNQQVVAATAVYACNDNTSSPLNDSFDAGIDWDAAIALADQQEKGPKVAVVQHEVNPALTVFRATEPTNQPQEKAQETLKGGAILRQGMTAPAAESPEKLPQPTIQQNAIASLRPSAWKQSTSSNQQEQTQQVQQQLPSKQSSLPSNMLTLPPSLQFKYPIPPPLDDDDDENDTDESNSTRQRLVKHAALSEPLDNGWTLFSHQKRAILRGLVRRRMILALDMGLGKTLTACVWARAFQRTFEGVKVIVICPVSLKAEWKRTAEQATSLKVQNKEPCDWTSTDLCIASWAKIPSAAGSKDSSDVTKYVVIADEAHSMQSMAAARTQEALRLMITSNSSRCKCVGVLLLTGTPMKNGKPANLFPLLKAVQHPFGDHQRDYEIHFCAGHQQHFGARSVWNAGGASNLVQLRELVSSHVLHITKDNVMKELPLKTRVIHSVPVSAKSQLQHTQALKDLAKVYHSSTDSNSNVDKNDSILGAVQRVRLVSSFAKVDATVQLAQQTLEKEPAIVIFTSFVEVAKLIHKRLQVAGWDGHVLTGETPPKKRQGMVDEFQNGLSPVFVVTFGAGGVGLTLTAACTVILLDRPWTPGDALQAEDRVRRIGQTKAVTSLWVSAFDLDRQIDALLEQKNNTSNVVLAAATDDTKNGSTDAPRISVFQMLRSILPGAAERNAPAAETDGMRQTSMLEFSQKG